MNYRIVAIPGDGIGPEVVREAILILDKIGEEFNHKFEIKYALAGDVPLMKWESLCHMKH